VVVAATLTTLTVWGSSSTWFFGSLGDMRVKGVEHATEGTDSGGAHESITFVSGRHAMLFGRLVGCLAGITLTGHLLGGGCPCTG
jgi:hypothetical protein